MEAKLVATTAGNTNKPSTSYHYSTTYPANEKTNDANNMSFQILLLLILSVVMLAFNHWVFGMKRKRRRGYYRDEYLKSDAWKRKRYVVLRRDKWRCVYCGAPATEVHHKKYARKSIGKEPIKWLVSVCKPCHHYQHR